MIIAPMFDGDEAEELQLAQARLYPDALAMIVGRARNALFEAEALVQINTPLGDLVRANRFDSGFLGRIHDLLAAIWRAEHDHLQPELPQIGRTAETLAQAWLVWLRGRVGRMAPHHLRTVLLAAYDDREECREATAAFIGELERELVQTAQSRATARAGAARL